VTRHLLPPGLGYVPQSSNPGNCKSTGYQCEALVTIGQSLVVEISVERQDLHARAPSKDGNDRDDKQSQRGRQIKESLNHDASNRLLTTWYQQLLIVRYEFDTERYKTSYGHASSKREYQSIGRRAIHKIV
jgi:hypothetical protein